MLNNGYNVLDEIVRPGRLVCLILRKTTAFVTPHRHRKFYKGRMAPNFDIIFDTICKASNKIGLINKERKIITITGIPNGISQG